MMEDFEEHHGKPPSQDNHERFYTKYGQFLAEEPDTSHYSQYTGATQHVGEGQNVAG